MPTKVLVVEDNPDVMFVLLSAVDSQRCEFIGVEEGTSVLPVALKELPSLIIIDVMLPGMNGFEVCRKIRTTDELKDVKILGISGHVSARDIEPGLFDQFLEKPFDVANLVEKMADLLGWRSPMQNPQDRDIVMPDQDEDEPLDLTWDDENK
jgi:CheY-like chemotaxis protein